MNFDHNKEQFVKLLERCPYGTRELQDIVAALRGPDFIYIFPDIAAPAKIEDSQAKLFIRQHKNEANDTHLKWYTTARIRAVVCPYWVGAVNHRTLSDSEIQFRDELLAKLPSRFDHFRTHYRAAAEAIRKVFNIDLIREL